MIQAMGRKVYFIYGLLVLIALLTFSRWNDIRKHDQIIDVSSQTPSGSTMSTKIVPVVNPAKNN
jgi:hypothetical protein